MYLEHHGVQGQRWGVRNGPPYPLVRVTKGSRETSNEIYDTLDKHQRYKLVGNAKEFVREQDVNRLVDQVLVKYKNIPVSAFDIWKREGGNVSVSIETRSGYQGKGFADKAVKAGLETLKKYEDVKCIYWGAYKNNTGSRKLAENNGFELQKEENRWVVYMKENK